MKGDLQTLAALKASSDFLRVNVFFFSSTETVVILTEDKQQRDDKDGVSVNFDGNDNPIPAISSLSVCVYVICWRR